MKKKLNVAVIGATGMVGKELLAILHEQKFPIDTLSLFASKNSQGKKVPFGDIELAVDELNPSSFDKIDIAFFATSSETAKEYCAIASKKGILCIDKSSAHREDLSIPLIAWYANDEELNEVPACRIIAVPNCVAIPLTQVLKPLQQEYGLRKIIISTYQAVSGAGQTAVDTLQQQVRDLFNMREPKLGVFDQRIAFNAICSIPNKGDFDINGNSEEEAKVINETRRILKEPDLPMAATCVRVPIFNGHSMSCLIELQNDFELEAAKRVLANSDGLVVIDNPQRGIFPTPLDACGENKTLVGRIRKAPGMKNTLLLWACSDNLRTGAALNAVRIAEFLCDKL